jgi:hypothetical protein
VTGPRQAPTGYATLSLDLDDVWAYLRTRGEPDWASTPSILPLAAERLIAVLDDLGLRITVFVVGRDAERAGGQEAITALAQAGHEVASHSYLHRGELATLPAGEIAEDLRRTADAIAAVTGAAPRGFRCPSFGRSPALLQTLVDEGYRYDASVLPTWMAPVLKAFYAVRMRSRDRDGEPAGDLFGPAANALLPLTPFRWSTGSGQLLELPVSTVPVLRTPMHMSYQQALGAKSESAADHYLRWGLKLLYARSVPPSFLLHPTDVLDDRDARRLSYFPGMNRPSGAKVAQLRRALAALADRFEVVPLGEAARRLEGARLPARRSDAALRAPAEMTRGRP